MGENLPQRASKLFPRWNQRLMSLVLRDSWVCATSFVTIYQTCPLEPSNSVSLLKKDIPFKWTLHHTKEFEDLKRAVTSSDVMLYHPDWNSSFELHVDASKLGHGAMLAQWKDDKLRPVRFASRAFSPA